MLINFDKILKDLSDALIQKNLKISLCESCTGGLVSKLFTDYSGSSLWFSGAVVTYSNSLKETLGVSKESLLKYGAVSSIVAKEMSSATLELVKSDLCLSITGVAGPEGGSTEKPVGTVYFSYIDVFGRNIQKKCLFEGDRNEIRYFAAEKGIQIILDCVADIKTQ